MLKLHLDSLPPSSTIASWDDIRFGELLQDVCTSIVSSDGTWHLLIQAGVLGVAGWILLALGIITEWQIIYWRRKKQRQILRWACFGPAHLGLLSFLGLYGVAGIKFAFGFITPIPFIIHLTPLFVGLFLGVFLWSLCALALKKLSRRKNQARVAWLSKVGWIGLVVILVDIGILLMSVSEFSEIWLKAIGYWK